MYNVSFEVWLKDEVKDILKANYVDKSLSTECDSPEEVEIEEVVNFIFECSSYKDKMWIIYPEEHKYAGQERSLTPNY